MSERPEEAEGEPIDRLRIVTGVSDEGGSGPLTLRRIVFELTEIRIPPGTMKLGSWQKQIELDRPGEPPDH